ncbi:DUF58 domain-containing protein [Actinomadura sp. WMMB 499]|uniref:DUF58 domain-containing protein n=1 Tax=Actinomadura sp. WMMB 499 TaxID=1219491 RepID=UPI001246136B|nr:DUF58 domain-containing protein [Actinomadura sp. WMMB 499]QFG19844.1 DUF58 domain-containing protein [Actinomadura sp. WMMB 499]
MTTAPGDGADGRADGPRRSGHAADRPGGPGGPARLAPERTLRRLELQVTRRLNGLLNGEHLGLLPGPGTELAEARLYQPGEDDVRHMDWAVTARTTSPHVRDLVADHELEAWALVDMTPSMEFGTADLVKRELAVAALAAVGFMTVRLGDRVGAYLLHGGGLRRWPARTGKAPFYALLQAVLDARPHDPGTSRSGAGPDGDARPGGGPGGGPGAHGTGPGDLAAAIGSLDRGQSRRGLRVIISDFLPSPDDDPAALAAPPDGAPGRSGAHRPPWERPLRRLAARHQVLAVEIIDPRELELPDIGLIEMTDPETGAVHEIVLNRRVRDRYARAAAEQRAGTREALRRCGVHHLVLRTDRDWIADVARFALRQRRAAGRPVTTAGVRP